MSIAESGRMTGTDATSRAEAITLVRETAYHEAGHAVAACVVRIPLVRVSLVSEHTGGFVGGCELRLAPSFPDGIHDYARTALKTANSREAKHAARHLRRTLAVSLSGPAAEAEFAMPGTAEGFERMGDGETVVTQSDRFSALQDALWLHRIDVGDPTSFDHDAVALILRSSMDTAQELLRSNWLAVGQVAQALVVALFERKAVSGSTVRRIVRESGRAVDGS